MLFFRMPSWSISSRWNVTHLTHIYLNWLNNTKSSHHSLFSYHIIKMMTKYGLTSFQLPMKYFRLIWIRTLIWRIWYIPRCMAGLLALLETLGRDLARSGRPWMYLSMSVSLCHRNTSPDRSRPTMNWPAKRWLFCPCLVSLHFSPHTGLHIYYIIQVRTLWSNLVLRKRGNNNKMCLRIIKIKDYCWC